MKINRDNFDIEPFHRTELIYGEFKSKGLDRKRHLQQAVRLAELAGHKMEFGVYRGKTIQHISAQWPNDPIWGFDSFEGLPEPWFTNRHDAASHGQGHFDLRREETQPVYPANVRLVRGWFDQSLPVWLATHDGPVSFLHVDCDLYSSTKTVLTLLNDRIVPGTVIVFDEFYPWEQSTPYALWAEHEYLALKEWTQEFDREFCTLLRSQHQQCSIKILR